MELRHLERLCEEWSPENLLWDYERIIDDIIKKITITTKISNTEKNYHNFFI